MLQPSAEAENRPETATRRRRWLWVGAFLIILGICLAVDEPLYDHVFSKYHAGLRPVPTALKLPKRLLRSAEVWGENIYVLIVMFAMWRLDSRRRSRVFCLGLASVVVALSVEGVKRLTGRERPEVSHGDMVFHGPGKWSAGGDFQSFPSGHTAAAGAHSGALSVFYPPLRPAAIALAIGCGGSRMWEQRHYLSDCWLGGVFGFWFAYTLPRRRWMQRWCEKFDQRFSAQ